MSPGFIYQYTSASVKISDDNPWVQGFNLLLAWLVTISLNQLAD